MASTNDQIAASKDSDLRARAVAAAQIIGMDSADAWVQSNFGRLLCVEVTKNGEPTTATDEYASAMNKRPPAPGIDPDAVTDDMITAAIQAMRDAN
jgi:hypothetical protein